MLAEFLSSLTLYSLEQPPSMKPTSTGPSNAFLSSNGETSRSTRSASSRIRSFDVEQRHVAAEAAGQRAGRQRRLCLFRDGCDGHGLRLPLLASMSLPIGALSKRAAAVRHLVGARALTTMQPTGQTLAALSMAAIWVSPSPPSASDIEPHLDTASFKSKYRLAVFHSRGADAARAQNASVVVEIDVGMRGVDLSSRPLIGLGGRHHAEAVAERLQLAISARDTIRAGMMPSTNSISMTARLSSVSCGVSLLDHHAPSRRGDAGRPVAAIDLAGADPAVPGRRKVRMVAEARK